MGWCLGNDSLFIWPYPFLEGKPVSLLNCFPFLCDLSECSFMLQPGPMVIKLFSCSTQLSKKFQLLIKTKMLKMKTALAFKLSDDVFIILINVKMPQAF